MKSKTKSPHRFALYLIATILGYFVCGFVAQRVLADETPKRPEYLIIYDLGPLPPLKAEPTNIKIVSGYALKLMVGDAVLTKKSVVDLIETLKDSRENYEIRLRVMSRATAVAKADSGATDEMMQKVVTQETVKISARLVKIDAQIAELQKLADALAEEKAK